MENLELIDPNRQNESGFDSEGRGESSRDFPKREEVYSKVIRAGKRTYFFDVRATRGGELFLNITESRKRFDQDDRPHFEKHTLFLYREDFEKFEEGLQDVFEYIREGNLRDDSFDESYGEMPKTDL